MDASCGLKALGATSRRWDVNASSVRRYFGFVLTFSGCL